MNLRWKAAAPKLALVAAVLAVWVWALTRVRYRGDDPWFATMVRTESLVGWVARRWMEWSSRVAPEAFLWLLAPGPAVWWIAATSGLYLVQVFYLYRYFTTAAGHKAGGGMLGLMVAAIAPWLVASSVAGVAILYRTGSINYFWMGVLFLVALYAPFVVTLTGKLPARGFVWASVVTTAVVAISQEQFGMELVLLIGLAAAYHWWREGRGKAWDGRLGFLTAQFVLSAAGFVAAMLAPGNSLRFGREMARVLPDLYTVPLWVRAESGIRWFLDRFVNHSGLILIAVWLLLAYLVWARRRWLAVAMLAAAVILATGSVLAVDVMVLDFLRGVGFAALTDFDATWGFHGGVKSWAVVGLWTVLLGLTVVATWVAFPDDRAKAATAIALLGGSFVALAALWVSPVMYISGFRLVYASSLILTVLLMMLVAEALFRRGVAPEAISQPNP